MSTFGLIVTLACVATAIVAAALGAHVFRWELIVWAAGAGTCALRLWRVDRR